MDERYDQLARQFRVEAQSQERLNSEVPTTGVRRDIQLPGRTVGTVFYPASVESAPIIFAFHGGGFVFGGCALDDALHHTLSQELSANVVSVGYRKGEQNPFPVAVNDSYDAVRHYLGGLEEDLAFDRDRVATFGSSAGANLAVTTSILAQRRGEFRVGMQILNYPFLDLASDPEDKGYGGDDLIKITYFNNAYARPEERTDPLVSPVLAADDDFAQDMKVIVTLADIDPLRAEGESYAKRLRGLGLEVAEHVARGQGHAYLELAFRDLSQGFVPPLVKAGAEDGSLYVERDRTIRLIKEHWMTWVSG